jgi:hypothetical protein
VFIEHWSSVGGVEGIFVQVFSHRRELPRKITGYDSYMSSNRIGLKYVE